MGLDLRGECAKGTACVTGHSVGEPTGTAPGQGPQSVPETGECRRIVVAGRERPHVVGDRRHPEHARTALPRGLARRAVEDGTDVGQGAVLAAEHVDDAQSE